MIGGATADAVVDRLETVREYLGSLIGRIEKYPTNKEFLANLLS